MKARYELRRRIAYCLLFASALLVSCDGNRSESQKLDAFESLVGGQVIGTDPDQWIEMKNITGKWERTGLVFGYNGDFEECQKAIDGMKRANPAREYRCVPANSK